MLVAVEIPGGSTGVALAVVVPSLAEGVEAPALDRAARKQAHECEWYCQERCSSPS